MRPSMALVRRERREREAEQAAPREQADRINGLGQGAGREKDGDQRDAGIAVQLEEPVVRDALRVAVVLSKRCDQQAPNDPAVGREKAVAEPVHRTCCEVGGDETQDQSDRQDPEGAERERCAQYFARE